MNNQELAIAVKKHKLIQKIIEQRLATTSLVNQLIAEEVMQEAPKNTLSNKLTQLLKDIDNPTEDLVKAAIKQFLSNIQNGDDATWTALFPTWPKMSVEKKAAFKKAGQDYKPDEQKRIATTIANAMSDGKLEDSEIEAIADATVADVEQGLGDLSGEDEEGDAASALETVSDYLGYAAAISSLGGPPTSTVTMTLSTLSDAGSIVNIYKLAEQGKTEEAFIQLTGLATAKAIEAMVPGGKLTSEVEKAATKQIAKVAAEKTAEKGGEEAIKLALKQLGKLAATGVGKKLAEKMAEDAIQKGKKAQGEIEKEEGMLDKVKGWFGKLIGGEEETTEAPIDVGTAERKYGKQLRTFLPDDTEYNLILKFLALMLNATVLKEEHILTTAFGNNKWIAALKKAREEKQITSAEQKQILTILKDPDKGKAFTQMIAGEIGKAKKVIAAVLKQIESHIDETGDWDVKAFVDSNYRNPEAQQTVVSAMGSLGGIGPTVTTYGNKSTYLQDFLKLITSKEDKQDPNVWFDGLDDKKKEAVQAFIDAYKAQLSEGQAAVIRRAGLKPKLALAAGKKMDPAAWKIVKDLMINDAENLGEFLKGQIGAQPEATPQPEGEIPLDPSKPMREQEAFAENLKIYDDAVSEFDRRFMRVPLLVQQQKIYVNLVEALEELFDQKKALTRTDKGEAPEKKEVAPEEPETASSDDSAETAAESLIREASADVVDSVLDTRDSERERLGMNNPDQPEKETPAEPEEDTGVKFFDVDPKVMRNIKIDLRYIEDAISKLHTMFEDFITGPGATKRFSEEEKEKIINYAKRLQMKIAESYHMISSIGPMNESEGAELSRDEMIDMVEDVWDNTVPQLKELNTLMDQAVTYEKVHGKANEIVDLLKTISEFFPQTAKFTSDAKRGSKKAIAELDEKIKNFKKEALPRIYALLKDDKIDSTKLNRTLMELKILSETIQELLGIKSQIKGAAKTQPVSDDPNAPALSDDIEAQPEDPIDDPAGETPEEETPEEETPEGEDVKEIENPVEAVREYKRKFPFDRFKEFLPEATPEMYDAFMTMYLLLKGQAFNPGGHEKKKTVSGAPHRELTGFEESEDKKELNVTTLAPYIRKVFQQSGDDSWEFQKFLKAIDKAMVFKERNFLKHLGDLFTKYEIADLIKMRNELDKKTKGLKFVNWTNDHYPRLNFLRTIRKPDAGEIKSPPFLEEQLIGKLLPIVEQVMLDAEEEQSEVEYIAKLLWGDDDLQGQLPNRLEDVVSFIQDNNESLGYDEEWGGTPNLIAPYASLEGSNLILHLEDQPVQFDLTNPHEIKDLTFHFWYDKYPLVSYREGFMNKLKAAAWGVPDLSPEEQLQEKLVPIIERMLGDYDG